MSSNRRTAFRIADLFFGCIITDEGCHSQVRYVKKFFPFFKLSERNEKN